MVPQGLSNINSTKGRPAEKYTAKGGELFGMPETGEITVQNTNFIINIKNPQSIYGPAYAFGHIEAAGLPFLYILNISSHF